MVFPCWELIDQDLDPLLDTLVLRKGKAAGRDWVPWYEPPGDTPC